MVDELRLEFSGLVASIVIDRPDRRNAFTQDMWNELPGLVAAACSTDSARVIVVRSSTPGVFSAGADIAEYRDHIGDVDWGIDNQERVSRGTAALRSAALPVIALVDGPAFGAGAALVASCDVRLASRESTFAITPAKLGMVFPFPETAVLVDLVGAAAARRLLLTGATFDAADALRIGFVDQVVGADEIESALSGQVEVLVANSPTSIRLMKVQIALAEAGQKSDDHVTRALVREALQGGDYAEGAQAFLERRPPRFT